MRRLAYLRASETVNIFLLIDYRNPLKTGLRTKFNAQVYLVDPVQNKYNYLPDEFKNPVLTTETAIGRNGELADLDGVTIFLAAAASDYITGQIIHLDGGFTAK